jgi:hypothetical protein
MNLTRSIKTIAGVKFGTIFIAACVLFASAGRSLAAGYKTVMGGITVSYSLPGAVAYYDTNDNTLTISVSQSGGSLNVTIGSTAYASWGNGVDIYILAGSTTFKSISIKGTPSCWPYVCGDIFYTAKFSLFDGVVGNTVYYGMNFGLGAASTAITPSISLKNSWTTAQLLGYPNPH